MSDLERLTEALEFNRMFPVPRGVPSYKHQVILIDAARSYRDLLANGVEPDYEAAIQRFKVVTGDIDGVSPGDVKSIVDAAIGDRLLVEPPTEEKRPWHTNYNTGERCYCALGGDPFDPTTEEGR